jgi:hypothetical protein
MASVVVRATWLMTATSDVVTVWETVRWSDALRVADWDAVRESVAVRVTLLPASSWNASLWKALDWNAPAT